MRNLPPLQTYVLNTCTAWAFCKHVHVRFCTLASSLNILSLHHGRTVRQHSSHITKTTNLTVSLLMQLLTYVLIVRLLLAWDCHQQHCHGHLGPRTFSSGLFLRTNFCAKSKESHIFVAFIYLIINFQKHSSSCINSRNKLVQSFGLKVIENLISAPS